MRRLLFAFILVAFAAASAVVPSPALAKPHDHWDNNHRKCPAGYRWAPHRHTCVPKKHR